MIRILIVEDDPHISNLAAVNLEKQGYACECAYDGLTAADLLERERFDLVLLDIMLPGADGYELMDYIRPLGTPVIFLTAKTAVAERVRGLRLGAEDYISKPFEIVELIARVEVVLRRYKKLQSVLFCGDLEIDAVGRSVRKKGLPVELTPIEFDLLLLLVRNRGIALFRDRIYEEVWGGGEMAGTRTVDLHIQRLRKKLGLEKKIASVYKVGYRLEEEGGEGS